MGSIRVLEEHVANQIAAGEVIERPSSIVKELVENSLDAGSTEISVSVEEGGLHLIRVADNGTGIEADDLELAFLRHATSKISSGKDLFHIRTLGFRGEALPSIAAVAKVECVSSPSNDGLGRKIVIEGGNVKSIEDTAARRGTDITVKDLFYNIPARLKYLKTVQTELGHISDYMYRLALAHPNTAFRLRHNGSLMLQTSGNGDLLQVIAAIYGPAVAKAMLPLRADHPDYTITGYISRPDLTRSNRNAITLVVNGRTIRSYTLSAAIMNAYHTLLPINRYPVAVLDIRMEPSLVDVNVHPAKLEVRFSKEKELAELAETSLRAVLRQEVLIPQASAPAPKPAIVQEKMELYRPSPDRGKSRADHPKAGSGEFAEREERARFAQPAPAPWKRTDAGSAAESGQTQSAPRRSDFGPPGRSAANVPARGPDAAGSRQQAGVPFDALMRMMPEKDSEQQANIPAFPRLEPIGQLHGTYIVAQNEDGLFLIDQHAAHERINYEYYYEKFGNPAEASQQLLVPITLEFTAAEAEAIAEKLPLLEQAGVVLERFGGNAYLIRSLPHWIPSGEEKAIVEEMADWLLDGKKSIDLTKLREKAAILCACKASIKANESLSTAEIEALLDRLASCGNPYTCPHGRPIVVSFSTYELEKMFKRVM
jgi:DNA mismatch repair protein MutL